MRENVTLAEGFIIEACRRLLVERGQLARRDRVWRVVGVDWCGSLTLEVSRVRAPDKRRAKLRRYESHVDAWIGGAFDKAKV
jgi:hypothetical protein